MSTLGAVLLGDGCIVATDSQRTRGAYKQEYPGIKAARAGGVLAAFSGCEPARRVVEGALALTAFPATVRAIVGEIRREFERWDWQPEHSDGRSAYRDAAFLLTDGTSLLEVECDLNWTFHAPGRPVGQGSGGPDFAVAYEAARMAAPGTCARDLVEIAMRVACASDGASSEPYYCEFVLRPEHPFILPE